MYLNGGTWNGRTILSPEWIEASASAYTPLSGPDYAGSGAVGYSYGWWVMGREYGRGAYAAWGWGGQKLIVMPDLDMVVVFTGGSYWEPAYLRPHEMMVGHVLPAIE